MRILLALLVLALHSPAAAETHDLRISVDASVTCIKALELESSLRRSGFHVLASDESGDRSLAIHLLGDSKRVRVEIVGQQIALDQSMAVAPCASQTEVTAAFIATTLASLPSVLSSGDMDNKGLEDKPAADHTHVENKQGDNWVQQRATLLTPYLDRFRANTMRNLGLMSIATSGVVVGLGAFVVSQDGAGSSELFVAGGVLAGGGLASFFVPDEYRVPLVGITSQAALAGMLLHRGVRDEQPTYLVLGLGGVISTGLTLADTLWEEPVSEATMEAHYKRLRDPLIRSQLTTTELKHIERDFKRSHGVLPMWLRLTPIVFDTAGLLYVASRTSSREDLQIALFGASILTAGGLLAYLGSQRTGYNGYKRDLGFTKLDLRLTATGVQGRF